jgi:predicted nucleic acid-binding protein
LRADTDVNQDRIDALGADILITAVAKANEAPIVTRNVAEFEPFEGVRTESY